MDPRRRRRVRQPPELRGQYHLPLAKPPNAISATRAMMSPIQKLPHDHENDADDDQNATDPDSPRAAAPSAFCRHHVSFEIGASRLVADAPRTAGVFPCGRRPYRPRRQTVLRRSTAVRSRGPSRRGVDQRRRERRLIQMAPADSATRTPIHPAKRSSEDRCIVSGSSIDDEGTPRRCVVAPAARASAAIQEREPAVAARTSSPAPYPHLLVGGRGAGPAG